jgi:uncharacterized protein YndB with AHSA1/START domain
MTALLTFRDEGGETGYSGCVRNWSEQDRAAHEAMRFRQGWGIAPDQLGALAAALQALLEEKPSRRRRRRQEA